MLDVMTMGTTKDKDNLPSCSKLENGEVLEHENAYKKAIIVVQTMSHILYIAHRNRHRQGAILIRTRSRVFSLQRRSQSGRITDWEELQGHLYISDKSQGPQ